MTGRRKLREKIRFQEALEQPQREVMSRVVLGCVREWGAGCLPEQDLTGQIFSAPLKCTLLPS